ncbi:hypothetical protein K488DRAFT_73075 [Vararia minispora EC-137]|uniref:Uncharacterized protein n=1 Tax=Vararia minispora EC-137 TaxID=1314806 RepID=A0ACB8QC46_9AGAM|nr:hypothetical protein K488DRAFT_73075 [Vararia minispora EC-137]
MHTNGSRITKDTVVAGAGIAVDDVHSKTRRASTSQSSTIWILDSPPVQRYGRPKDKPDRKKARGSLNASVSMPARTPLHANATVDAAEGIREKAEKTSRKVRHKGSSQPGSSTAPSMNVRVGLSSGPRASHGSRPGHSADTSAPAANTPQPPCDFIDLTGEDEELQDLGTGSGNDPIPVIDLTNISDTEPEASFEKHVSQAFRAPGYHRLCSANEQCFDASSICTIPASSANAKSGAVSSYSTSYSFIARARPCLCIGTPACSEPFGEHTAFLVFSRFDCRKHLASLDCRFQHFPVVWRDEQLLDRILEPCTLHPLVFGDSQATQHTSASFILDASELTSGCPNGAFRLGLHSRAANTSSSLPNPDPHSHTAHRHLSSNAGATSLHTCQTTTHVVHECPCQPATPDCTSKTAPSLVDGRLPHSRFRHALSTINTLAAHPSTATPKHSQARLDIALAPNQQNHQPSPPAAAAQTAFCACAALAASLDSPRKAHAGKPLVSVVVLALFRVAFSAAHAPDAGAGQGGYGVACAEKEMWTEAARKEGGAAAVRIVNEVDGEEVPNVPPEFEWLERGYVGPPDSRPTDAEMAQPCGCTGPCTRESGCSCVSTLSVLSDDFACAYDRDRGRVLLMNARLAGQRHPFLVHECSAECGCRGKCTNRAAHAPRDVVLEVFKTANGRGWGVRAAEDLPAGKVLGMYTGELTRRDANEDEDEDYDVEEDSGDSSAWDGSGSEEDTWMRDAGGRGKGKKMSAQEERRLREEYEFNLDWDDARTWRVGAYSRGNWTRFINVTRETDPRWNDLPTYLAFVTTEAVKARTELTVDYNPGGRVGLVGRERCLCRTAGCRGFMRGMG